MTEQRQEKPVIVVTDSWNWKSLTKLQLNTKLLLACTIRDSRTAETAIEHGANVNCRRSDHMSPLHIAAEHGDVTMMRLLCKSLNVNPEAKTMHGLTPMHTAALLGHTRVIYELLRIGAMIDCKDNLQRCPIHYAALQNDIDCARYLIRAGSPIHAPDVFEDTPAHISVLKTKNMPMIKLFLAYRLRRSPFTPEDARRLLQEAVLGARDEYDIKIIDMILQYGEADVINLSDPIGWRTPLHVVAMTGYFDLAKYLIDHGANLEARNSGKLTPTQIALSCKNLNIVRLIQDKLKSMETNKTELS